MKKKNGVKSHACARMVVELSYICVTVDHIRMSICCVCLCISCFSTYLDNLEFKEKVKDACIMDHDMSSQQDGICHGLNCKLFGEMAVE